MNDTAYNLLFLQFAFLVWCIHFISAPYPNRIKTVLAPYILHSEVPLYGENTEMVRSKYGSGMLWRSISSQ
ncbi:hypothetical protein DWW10_18340 [Bacteroides intestinalis]|uniref:Uncharacterized protein n=1 Tax=Bacteroides intestinalis TaxID=329854 RepID=A0A412XYF7_9BACE|nr:hypothetical protein DWW10_18340 [Bacteroides intestinalis]RHA56482.1 hypothetical protein DW932_19355 [Bacteroides intestinalis]